jgi:hypothetical protein
VPPLEPVARRVLATSCVNALGSGFTLPFLLLYLHAVRGLPLTVTGFVIATPGVAGVATGPSVATAIGRLGARRVLAASLGVSTVGALLPRLRHRGGRRLDADGRRRVRREHRRDRAGPAVRADTPGGTAAPGPSPGSACSSRAPGGCRHSAHPDSLPCRWS